MFLSGEQRMECTKTLVQLLKWLEGGFGMQMFHFKTFTEMSRFGVLSCEKLGSYYRYKL